MTAAAPRVGGTLTTAEQLDALPDKAVVLDEHEEPWQKLGEGLWCGSAGGPMSGTALLRTRTDEVTVLYVPGEQPRPSATDNARAEAWRRFPDGIDVETGEPVDDYGYPATAREAFIAGAEWAAARAETTDERVVHNHGPTDGPGLDCPETILPDGGLRGACLNRDETTTATTEDAARVLYRELRLRLPEALAPADEVTDWTTWKHIVTEVAGLLATARTRPTRDELAKVICESRCSPQRKSWLETADAVLALLADQPTEAPTSTQWAHRTASGGASVHRSRKAAELARDEYTSRPGNPFEPPPPASLGIWRREVTPWTKDGDDQ